MRTCDKNRIPIEVGDILKVYHFTAALRRDRQYIYKQVVGLIQLGKNKTDYFEVSHLDLNESGEYWIGLDEGVLKDYEVVQGIDKYPMHFKDRDKAQ